MSDETFVEGILGVGLGKGALRIDFYGIAEGVDEKGHPARERKHRLIMTTESFVETFNALQGVMTKLKEGGLVREGAAPAGETPGKPAGGTPGKQGEGEPGSPPPVSPNF